MRCGNCRFFKRNEVTSEVWDEHDFQISLSGQCRRHAPEPCSDPELPQVPEWPMVVESDWCGEHEPREAEQAQQC